MGVCLLLGLLAGCVTAKQKERAVQAAITKTLSEQTELSLQNAERARDLIRLAFTDAPPECGQRLKAGLSSADLRDGWRTAAKYESALVKANNRLQNCHQLQQENNQKVIALADELVAEAEGKSKPDPTAADLDLTSD